MDQKCMPNHTWDGQVPVVDGNKYETQFPDLVGRTCDCGKFIWAAEHKCGCKPPRWEAVINANPNYIPQ